MHRTLNRTLLALAAGAAATIAGPTTNAGITPVPLCTNLSNGDFSLGFAFWSADIQTGEFGDTVAEIFASAEPLSFLPAQGNIATFFTEAAADFECQTPLGSGASSTAVLSRTVLSAPAPTFRFRYGAQLSYFTFGGGRVEWAISAVLTNLTSGKQECCVIRRGNSDTFAIGEGIINIPFSTFTACTCTGNGFVNPGDRVEVEIVFSVKAEAKNAGAIAYIGGPQYSDDYQFCNILCADVDDVARTYSPEQVVETRPLGPGFTGSLEDRRTLLLDEDGDGKVTPADFVRRAERVGVAIDPEPGDVNADGVIDRTDIGALLRALAAGEAPLGGDLDANGAVDQADLEILVQLLP